MSPQMVFMDIPARGNAGSDNMVKGMSGSAISSDMPVVAGSPARISWVPTAAGWTHSAPAGLLAVTNIK